MSTADDKLDLPVAVGGEDLPISIAAGGPQQIFPDHQVYPAWIALASQRHVRDLARDLQGNLWVATGGGVLHWELGADRFTRYSSEHGLPGNSVTAVAVDGTGRVWAGHERFGLSALWADRWQPYRPLGETSVCCLTVDAKGQLWVGTDNGIYVIDADSRDAADRPPVAEWPNPDHLPRSMTFCSTGDLWICTAAGAYRFQDSSWLRASDSVQPGILALACQGESLWLGTIDGLVRMGRADKQQHRLESCPAGAVTALATGEQGVWAACNGQVGLATAASWTPIAAKRFNTPITQLVAAGDGNVWIGSHEGLFLGSESGLQPYLTDTPPDVIGQPLRQRTPITLSNLIQAIAIEPQRDRTILWIGTARGLFRLDRFAESWRRYGRLGAQDIRAVALAADCTVWAASWSSGLQAVSPQADPNSQPPRDGEPILALTQSVEAKLWAVGLGGLYHQESQSWKTIVPATDLPTPGWPQAVAQAVSDRVWLGTSTGLLVYRPDAGGQTEALTIASGELGNADVRVLLAIARGKTEQLWVGTNRGLYAGPPDCWQVIPELAFPTVTALVWDSRARAVWVGTDRGLFRLRCKTEVGAQQDWTIAAEFTVQNSGLAANRVTALALSANASGNTELWIGTPCGLSCYTY